jgi:acylaminoacyl-peptidase
MHRYVLLLAASLVSEAANRLTPADVFQLELASDPQISPDGSRVVYVRQFADIMSDRNYSNLWIVGFDGSAHRPITTGNTTDTSPRWSPDGTRLAYISDREGTPQIYVRWMDSGQTAKITNLQQAPSNLVWSPDGKQIAFTALVPSATRKIVELMPAPTGAKWADPAIVIDQPRYRHDLAANFNWRLSPWWADGGILCCAPGMDSRRPVSVGRGKSPPSERSGAARYRGLRISCE